MKTKRIFRRKTIKRCIELLLLTIAFISLVISCLYVYSSSSDGKNQHVSNRNITSFKMDVQNGIDQEKLILLYTTPSWLRYIVKKIDFVQCQISNCILTENTTLITSSSAVIFHGRMLKQYPPLKLKNQKWVFFDLETPYYLLPARYAYPQWRRVFDWTMTYRSDSDLFHPYAKISKKPSNAFQKLDYNDVMAKKKYKIAWLVSHCRTASMRQKYVLSLRKHISVDIYGKCGWQNCTLPNAFECYKKLSGQYLFFLSFENSLCNDYFTEKIFLTYSMGINMVPVVRGGAGYSKYFPAGTYINSADFKHPKDLAKYLIFLSNHKDKYFEYLQRKNEYEISIGLANMFRRSLCELCRKLNEDNRPSRKPIDIVKWMQIANCSSATDV